jgi:hypothetical protein
MRLKAVGQAQGLSSSTAGAQSVSRWGQQTSQGRAAGGEAVEVGALLTECGGARGGARLLRMCVSRGAVAGWAGAGGAGGAGAGAGADGGMEGGIAGSLLPEAGRSAGTNRARLPSTSGPGRRAMAGVERARLRRRQSWQIQGAQIYRLAHETATPHPRPSKDVPGLALAAGGRWPGMEALETHHRPPPSPIGVTVVPVSRLHRLWALESHQSPPVISAICTLCSASALLVRARPLPTHESAPLACPALVRMLRPPQ